MKVLLDIDLEYNQTNEHYQAWLKGEGLEDTPVNYVQWGIAVEFWGHFLTTKVIEVLDA